MEMMEKFPSTLAAAVLTVVWFTKSYEMTVPLRVSQATEEKLAGSNDRE